MQIESVKAFLEEYFLVELEANIASVDKNLTSREFAKKYDPLLDHFWGANRYRITHDLEDLKDVIPITDQLLSAWKATFYNRFVFQIEAYKHPAFGEKLAAKFPNAEDVYRCVLSDCKQNAMPRKMFSDAYGVVEHNGQWKFIYRERFIDGAWEPQDDGTKGHILSYGTLVDLASYVTPEDAGSLKHFERAKEKPRG